MAEQLLAGVNGAWSMYRQCAATAAFHKARLELFTKISLWLGLAGAAIGTAAQVLRWPPTSTESKVLGIVGSIAVALAGLAATQAVAGSREKIWVKCRALGEALKSAVYLYCAGVSPFADEKRSQVLAERVEKTLKDLESVDLQPASASKLPPGPLTVDDYIKVRVDDQITFYTGKARAYQSKADFWRFCSLAGAAVSACLGAISAIYSLSPWVALLATATTSITAYVKNQHYSSMIPLYQATAIRLQVLKDQWLDSSKTEADKADRDLFIQRCEETMSLESGAWTSQWLQQPTPQPTAPKDQLQQLAAKK